MAFCPEGLFNSAQWQRLGLNMNIPLFPFASLPTADLRKGITVLILYTQGVAIGLN